MLLAYSSFFSNMKLAAIYNVWDGVELLNGSLLTVAPWVDSLIIVYQEVSNYGDASYNPLPDIYKALDGVSVADLQVVKYSPALILPAFVNETRKRNLGIDLANLAGCTHFVHLDCDEFHPDFLASKYAFMNAGDVGGSVLKLYTYFKFPNLRCDLPDGYFVPFIHRIVAYPGGNVVLAGSNNYPYYVDPTRGINCSGSVVLLDYFMHHFSWVRSDINRKAKNSTAAPNIARGKILEDYNSPAVGPGFYVRDWDRRLIDVGNPFNLNL
jgi:hypothetical protein